MTKHSLDLGQRRQKQVRLSTKEVSDEGQFEGYGSMFGNEDSYGDIVAPGAFAESLQEHKAAGTMPALLWQHNPSEPIGVYVEMKEDEKGLYVKGQLELQTQRGQEAHALLRSGALNGLSIGYMVKRYERDEESNIYTLLEIDLWEVSLVTFPANGLARVEGVKMHEKISNLADWKSFEALLRDEGGFSKRSAAAMAASARRIGDNERDAQKAATDMMAASNRLLDLLKT